VHYILEIGVWAIAIILLLSIAVKVREDRKSRTERQEDRADAAAGGASDRKESDVAQ
jgi:hypothetical protein